MAAEPVANKRKLWWAVAIMFFISCLLTASGVLEFVVNGHLSLFVLLEIVFGVCGIIVTLVAWLLTFVL
jgi:16S rRNA G1207 methylase RsmC